ncbi:MAG: conserved rane protein of unknown function [Haloplasmataceae bacterium]|nr:conserved rane protein of unknown function [Haloplasmataceae bacterium]
MFFNLLILSITPGLALIIIIYFLDKHDKEPVLLLIKLFFYGVIISLPVIFFEKILMRFNMFSGFLSPLYTAFVVAGFTEEFFKRFVVLSKAYKLKEYNERFDGIVYAVVVSLGFATLENILYVVFNYHSYEAGITRAMFSVPGHMLFGINMGYFLSLSKFANTKIQQKHYFLISLFSPIILHGLFNFLIFVQAYLLLPVFMLFYIFLIISNTKKLNYFYREKRKIIKIGN